MGTGQVTAPDGVELAVSTTGSANGAVPPMVATHGWANDRSVWAPIVRELAGEPAVTTWDLRGHGESGIPLPGAYTRSHALADLAAVRDEAVGAGGGPAVLMGHSLGGFLSLAHEYEHVERLEDALKQVLGESGEAR